MYFNYCSNL
ncbi:hypothetical protein SPV_2469 [Streptococcus pneumoniae]|nr:hypothetical protein SPV_2469 [Streptococcus pneumoniae]